MMSIMKKLFLIIVLLFAFISCQDEVKFNNPSFQGSKDNIFWRAVDYKAIIAPSGSLQIEAYTRDETVTLKTTSTNPGTYFLGIDNLNTATYVLTEASGSTTFSTGFGVGDGQIVIKEYDPIAKTITGTFKFNAENTSTNPSAIPVLNFQYGVFYKVPISSAPFYKVPISFAP